MNLTKIIALSAGLILGATALSAQGFGPGKGGRGGMGGGMMGGGMMRGQAQACMTPGAGLTLTEAQQAGYKKILEAHKASLESKLKAANDARDAMRKGMQDPATSDAKVKELHAKASEAMTAVMLERRAMQREFEALLTPEQKNALELRRLQGGMMGRGGRGGRGGNRGCGGCF